MSLLDRGRHTVLVQRKKLGPRNGYNQPTYVDDGPAVAVRCSVRPLTAEESTALGLEVNTVFGVSARSWPGGVRSELSWNGRPFIPVGEPLPHTRGRRTQRVTVVMRAVAGEGH